MNAMCDQINATGKAFVEFSMPMLLQSGVLILILLGLDLILRKKVRAVFRYWIWMLVLAKLVLPTSLSSPVSLGCWFGEQLDYLNTKQPVLAAEAAKLPEPTPNFEAFQPAERLVLADSLSTEVSTQVPAPTPTAEPVRPVPADAPAASPDAATPVTWQAVVFLIWLVVVVTMGLLLLQRALFVRGLVAQAREANGLMKDAFGFCRKQIAVSGEVRLKVSPNATSPAVCGLFRPVILMPHNLASTLGSRDLRAVFLHELAHIKRGDLWVNLVQTVLQIIYFYNLLLWLANAIIRRVREQAVDEMVLVAMGEKARWYPETLVNVARLAFEQPALSLRLIGVVESKDALAARIRRILTRPVPKHAKLGFLGIAAVVITAAVLLPMAKAKIKGADIVTECKLFSKQYESLMKAWKRSNSTAEQIADTYLLIDTDKEAMWIERNGVVSNSERIDLVKNLKWEIYHVTPSGKTPLSSPLRLNLRSTPAQENVTQEWFFFNGRLGNSGEGCTFEISRNGYGSGFPYAENWNFTFPAKNTAEGVDVANIVDETMLVTPETDTEAGARSISQEERRTVLATLPNRVTVVLDSDKDGLEDRLEQELGTNPRLSDTDRDGLSDYDEHCKYRTDPTKKDSDSDGKPDGDWQERREYTYTIRAVCEIRPPSGLQVINDLYQDARPLDRKGSLEDAVVVELLLFPFATPHVYAQPYPKEPVDDALREYVRPTVSMNFSSEMKQHVGNIVEGADTDVQAIEKMLRWISTETELARYNPHWDYFHIVNDEIVWHGSLGDPEQDKRFLGTNFFADSMFKNKVHGTCSSTAILRGAMFRAAGLPTRLIQTLPLVTRYSEDPQPLADKLRMRAMANGYDWGPGTGGANHMYNEVFLNNRWVRVDNSIGTGPFVSDKLFVKAWSSTSLNNIKEEWNNKRCFRALDVSDAYPKYKSEVTRADVAIQNRDLTVKKLADGQYKATIIIHNNGQEPTPRLKVLFYAGDPDSGGRKVHPSYHRAGPIMPGATWGEATYPFILRESENEIFVVVDPDDAVQESDETNNKASTTINYTSEKAASGGLVDLAVADSDLRVSKLPDGRYFVSVTIHNRGSIVSPRFRIYHYSGDPDKAGKKLGRGYHNAGPIKPGETWKECGHFNLKPDDRQIFVVIDPDNTVRESDETNNKCFTEISSGPKKVGDLDIAVEDFKITFRDKYNAYYVVASIRNKGRDVSPQFPVHFYIGDPATAEPITHAAGPIKPGGVWNERSGNFGLRDGANLISVAVDPDNAFAESDETNNRASLSVLIEDGRIVKQSVSYSSAEAKERRPSPEHTEAVSPICPPAHQRHFVRLVVGPVTYRVTIPDDNWRIAKVNCQMATGGALSLWMNNNGAPRVPEGHGAFVRNLRAVDSAGNALVINDFGRGRWMIDGKDNQPVTLSYEVLLRHDESDLPWGPDEAPYVTEDGVFWTGRALFVVADMSDVTVRFNLPEGWRVSTPWGHRLNQESTFSLEDEEELTESFIFAGTHIEEQARVGDTEIVLVLGNALRGSREVIQNCLQELLRQYSELFGAAAPGRALVVVNAQDKKGSFDGGVFGSSVSMLMGDEPGRNNTGRWVPFVAHEVFHIWNGQALKHGGQEDWFSEGFTDYYAMVACARLNLISEEEFVRRLGRACEGYISISGNKPIRGAREHGLQYAGGSLVAACLDIQIRKLTDNTRNLDDLMRQMYEEFGRTGRQYCVEDVIRIANDIAGKDLGEFFKEYVEGTEELALEEAFADIGLELKKDVTEGLPARAYVIHKMLHIESLRHSGLLIRRSQEAGYRDEDRLRAIAGTPVESVRDIQTVAKRLNRGDKTEVVLLRDGKEVRMEITVGGEGKQVPLERKVEVEIEKEAELNASQKSILSGIIGS